MEPLAVEAHVRESICSVGVLTGIFFQVGPFNPDFLVELSPIAPQSNRYIRLALALNWQKFGGLDYQGRS